ncbi:helix-turn-helix transcriptional regulator [Streptomyces olivoreticuli]|uniref:helix-turn-helix domain-containing protein n=1 Tax=Streptomyces olivoreticuli TaxID=68246 RepID=UPI002659E64A|nr:helix-turn-helix transcriptional regulator [Streptomyces olivoreticuli]WKK21651.1 helix-turn-helix transcriptional regulator [Streptomyces olivoreticuli]
MIRGCWALTKPFNSSGSPYGEEVREWRTQRGMSQRELGAGMQYGQSYVAMVEKGDRIGSPDFAAHCDNVFGTPGTFTRLWQRASRRGRHPEWFLPYLELEAKATHVSDFSSYLIMGILQTESYARAIFRAANPHDEPETTAEKVRARLQRREVLDRSEPPLLWVILDESCLRRMVGSPVVMREQMAHLLEAAETPHVTLQVLLFNTGAPSTGESFTLLRFEEEPGVLYTEAQGMGRVIDSASRVARAGELYDRLRADALSPEHSLVELRKAMEELPR